MECKASHNPARHCTLLYWNISRMECKGSFPRTSLSFTIIGIYPEWNVKFEYSTHLRPAASIGIYPEWNVKAYRHTKYVKQCYIGIYPEWNVKKPTPSSVVIA